MKRVLVLSDTASLQDLNNRSNLNLLLEMNCEIHVGCNFTHGNTTSSERVDAFANELRDAGITCLQISFEKLKNPFIHQKNVEKELVKIFKYFDYDLVHCLTLTALQCAGPIAEKYHIPVMCTSYGLPVYEGVPFMKRLKLTPKLKKASKYAEVFVCCNHEDYKFAKNNFKSKHVFRIPGTGLDPYRFRAPTVSRHRMRDFMEIPQNAVTLITVGALTKQKNHAVILKALARLRMLEIHYVICGGGDNADYLYKLTRNLNLGDRVHFTKHRDDIVNMLHACDIFCLPSKEEGIGIAALEAMEAGLPLITSNVQCFKDFMEDGVTGFFFKPDDVTGFVAGIEALTEDKKLREQMGQHNRKAVELFYRENAEYVMRQIYEVQLEHDKENEVTNDSEKGHKHEPETLNVS